MSGHSQFANIKHRKDAQDVKRGKVFQKISREIFVAVKLYGANIENNPKLKTILEKARSLNMPKDNIDRAIKKASNQNDNTNYESVIYEGYLPDSIAVIIHCLTDNKNRTASNIRSYFNKCQGNLARSNSVQYLFSKVGIIEFVSKLSSDEVLELVLDFKVLDLVKQNDVFILKVDISDLLNVASTLTNAGIESFITNEIRNIPLSYLDSASVDDSNLNLYQKFLNLLDEDDDVQLIESNLKS